jgi:hypothetical protein
MKRFGLALAGGLLLFGSAAQAQSPTVPGTPETLDVLAKGWSFNNVATRAGAEAHTLVSAAGLVFAVTCGGTTPVILLYFRSPPPRYGFEYRAPGTLSALATFTFVKRGFAAALTSSFDTKRALSVATKQVTSGNAGGAAVSERIVIDGADAMKIVTQLKSMDQVSAVLPQLSQPISFELTDASPAIDKLLAVCASGP